ncbi:CMRF35-like molecule 7 isoform X1 [Sapajus apella]|uniref:CMRF35-like molecule 7 isoform X1 n=1 Tax=Sapajus apella TaxID=9515 RepID=A0A6J3EXC3_SAPAP|nr:CMRF35-like molecule 7 isoform X1 [Sapajus apella]
MWHPPALLLLILPGCFSIYGPGAVWGTEWDSLTVQCHYDQGWETYSKWWCRGSGWKSCEILVITTGSEHTVERDRVSIRDDQKNRVFTITMKILWRSDTDTYWCGIERTGTDLGVQVEVTVYPEPMTIVTTVPGTADTASPGTTDTALPSKAETTVPGKRNTAASGTMDTAVPRKAETAVPGTADTASPGTRNTAERKRTTTPIVLASGVSLSQNTNSSQPTALTSPLARILLCNIHFLLPTSLKGLLLVGLLCTVLRVSSAKGASSGK